MQTIKTILLLLLITLQTHANIPPQTTYNENHQPLVIEYADGSTILYEYDATGRTTSTTNQNNHTTTYTYDAVGNRLSSTDALGNKTTFTYDAQGNLVAKDSTTYEYDDKNRLIKTTTPTNTIEYSYDANDNRVAKTTDGETTTYLIDANTAYAQVITESKSDGTQIEYTYGNDLLSDGTHNFLTDALGSTRGLVDSSETLTDSYVYTPYGKLASHDGNATNSFLFTGEQLDSETEDYYLRARYYSSNSGRFLTRDSYDGRAAGSPLSQNHYLYAHGNPVMYIDPSGHFIGGFASVGMSIMSTIGSGYLRIAGTTERGMVVALYAKTLVVGLEMRNEALNSIIASILVGGFSQKDVNYAYDKYYQSTKILNMVSGTAYETYDVFSYMQAGLGFAKGLTKLPMANYSSVPFAYLSKTNSLNSKIAIGLEEVIKNRAGFEDVMEALKDMTDLMRRFVTSSLH